jgi:hypothetical protein
MTDSSFFLAGFCGSIKKTKGLGEEKLHLRTLFICLIFHLKKKHRIYFIEGIMENGLCPLANLRVQKNYLLLKWLRSCLSYPD